MRIIFLINFLIIIFIFLSNFNLIISQNEPDITSKNTNKRINHKNNRLLKGYLKKKFIGKDKVYRKKNKKYINKAINVELTNDFNNWHKIRYKDENIFNINKNNEIYVFNFDLKSTYNINPITSETYMINEDYKKNDLLIRYNNNKFNQNEEVQRHITKFANNQILKKDIVYQNQNIKQKEYKYHEENRNTYYSPDDEEFDYGMRHYRNERNFHHHDYNSMRHGSRGSSYINQPNIYSNYQSGGHKSKFTEYMNHIYQIMMVFFFIGLIYKLFLGNKQNDKYALAWYDANKDYFKERYEIFGLIEDEENGTFTKPEDMKDCILIKENPNNYKLICGNYRYIQYIAVNLQFHKRYDMSLLIASFFVSLKDKIVFQVTFNSVDPCGWVFCLGKKSQNALIKDNYEDLNYFCDIYYPKFMDEYMCLISEDLDIFEELFNNNKSLLQYYKNVEPYIETIYYSDLINLITEKNNIYFSFEIDLTTSYQNRILLEITHFVNLFVDSLAQIKYTNEFKEKVNNKRILYKESKINDSRKKEIEEKEKHDFIEKWKIKNKMKGKKGLERKKLEKQLKKYQ